MKRIITFIAVAWIIVAVPAGSRAAEFKITPSITVSEEYNDNIYLYPKKQVADYITHVIPGVHVVYLAPFWDWDIKYSYERRIYAREPITNDNPENLNLTSQTRIINDFLFLDVKDEYQRTSLSPIRDYTQVSPLINQTNQNILTLNPYVVLHPTTRTELKPGYQYRNVWYEDPIAIDKTVHTSYLDLKQEISPRYDMTATIRHEVTETKTIGFTQNMFLVGPRYEYQEKSAIWFKAGASKFTPYAEDQATRPVWDAGIIHKLPTITLSYETGRTWIDDPIFILRREDRYIAGIRREVERTSLGGTFGYREYGTGNFVDERRYTTTAFFSHFLTEKVQGSYGLTIDAYYRFPKRADNTTTIVYLTDVRFDYHVREALSYWINYQYTNSYSPDIYIDNYNVNSLKLGVTASF